MGASRSKVCPINFDDACKRVSPQVLHRIEETFKRSSSNGLLPKLTFFRDILGEAVPEKLSEAIYRGFGGGDKGLPFRELLSGLVLIVCGTKEEKAKFLAHMLSEDAEYVNRAKLEAIIKACDACPSRADLSSLFRSEATCYVEEFQQWLLSHPNMASFTTWLLLEEMPGFSLEMEAESLTFYQILGQKYGVSERDVMDVEKTYWALKGSGRLDLQTFQLCLSPPLPQQLVPDLFRVMDVNSDGHLDVSEVLAAVAVWCGGNPTEIDKFCFSVFDKDGDGLLNRSELLAAIQHMQTIANQNSQAASLFSPGSSTMASSNGDVNRVLPLSPRHECVSDGEVCEGAEEDEEEEEEEEEEIEYSGVLSGESLVESALAEYGKENEGFLNTEEYHLWVLDHHRLSHYLPHLLFEVSHVQLGVHPKTREDEAKAVGGYLTRFARTPRQPGDQVYILYASWFQKWKEYTGYQGVWPILQPHSSSSEHHQKKKKKKRKKWKMKKRKNNKVTEGPIKLNAPTGCEMQGDCEMIEMDRANIVKEKSPCGSYKSTATTSDIGSDPSILSRDELDQSLPPPPPPIMNSSLCVEDNFSTTKKLPSLTNEGGRLLTNKLLVEWKDFILLPEVVWKVLVMWYCSGTYCIPVLPRTIDHDGRVDLYPIFFKLYRHTTVPLPAKPSSLPWFITSIIQNLGVTSATPSAPMPVASSGGGELPPTQALTPRRVPYYMASFVKTTTLAEMSEKIRHVLHVKSEDLRLYSLADVNSPVLLEEEDKTIEEQDFYQQKHVPRDGFLLLVETRNKDNSWPEEMIALVNEVRDKGDTDKQKKKPQKSIQVQPGATGLSNLGNSCFMNSALQCVSNAKALTQYFQKRDHLLEINKDNPLGMQGVMAKRYGELIHELWSGNAKSITPLKFRFTVGHCAPHFTAFQQQDAQELLAFVLDGLHEDLNRVKDKAYRELSDSDGRPDEEVAMEAWDYHLSRNQSIIVDLFHGQLKSEVSCKSCHYTSVRFDPFTFLSLPLPMESTVNLEVIVMFLDGRQPVKYGLRMEIDDKYLSLKKELAKLCGIPETRLLLAEVYSSLIRNLVMDTTKVRNVLGGWLYAYELPLSQQVPNFQQSECPHEVEQQKNLHKLLRERTSCMSLMQAEEGRQKMGRVRDKLVRRNLREEEDMSNSEEEEEQGDGFGDKSPRVVINVLEQDEDEMDEQQKRGKQKESENSVNHEHAHEVIELNMDVAYGDGNVTSEAEGEVSAGHCRQDSEAGGEVSVGLCRQDSEVGGEVSVGLCRQDSEAGGEVSVRYCRQDSEAGGEVSVGYCRQDSEEEINNSFDSHLPLASHRPFASQKDMYVYAIHRRSFSIEHYFVSSQKTRPILFSIPLIVPCLYYMPRVRLYAAVWTQFKRLIIPEPMSSQERERESDTTYPFVIKQVTSNAMNCSRCPWHRFCRGCVIPCDYGQVGNIGKFIAIDWDETTLHLKYLMAQEKAEDHASMETLKSTETMPIDLYKCFRAFVRKDQLGEDESWYCKRCKTHREAVKSLEIWRLPPILIIHLKRFQFVNGHWIKSQRVVKFPLENLDPLRYNVQNGNGRGSAPQSPKSVTTPVSHCSTEPMEVVSRGDSSSGQKTSHSSNEVGGRMGEEVVVCRLYDKGGVGVADWMEKAISGDRSSDMMDAPMEAGHNADSSSSQRSESEKTMTTPNLDSADDPKLYKLFAISCHSGMLGGGHYTSFAKNANNNWYYYNDSSCKETTPERVEQESPYMLFYELQNIDSISGQFRAQNRQGKAHQDICSTEDDREYEETLKNINKSCSIQ